MNSNLQPEIVSLEPTRVASCCVIGKNPEREALRMMRDWAIEADLIGKKDIRYYGFDNPAPSASDSEYGYEVWMAIGADTGESGNIKIKDFPGGLYAVHRTRLSKIGQAWKDLLAWREESDYREGRHQCLEEHRDLPLDNSPEDVEIDLYLPIKE